MIAFVRAERLRQIASQLVALISFIVVGLRVCVCTVRMNFGGRNDSR